MYCKSSCVWPKSRPAVSSLHPVASNEHMQPAADLHSVHQACSGRTLLSMSNGAYPSMAHTHETFLPCRSILVKSWLRTLVATEILASTQTAWLSTAHACSTMCGTSPYLWAWGLWGVSWGHCSSKSMSRLLSSDTCTFLSGVALQTSHGSMHNLMWWYSFPLRRALHRH